MEKILYKKTLLPGGLRLISEKVPGAMSAALGIFVAAGSQDEQKGQQGIAHLIEHMAFKGTKERNTLAIAKEIDLLGGQTNAYTSKDFTVYHTRVLSEHLPRAVDFLWDIFQNSIFDPAELEKEKQVVCQEIMMLEDCPEDLIYDRFMENFWPGQNIGRPITGTLESVAALDRPSILKFLKKNYQPPQIIISCVGNVSHEKLLNFFKGKISSLKNKKNKAKTTKTKSVGGFWQETKKLEQAHLLLGLPFPAITSEERYAASLFNAILGGNMSSRLFQEIREKRGLAYSVYSHYAAFENTALLSIYTGAGADKIPETLTVILEQLKRLAQEKVNKSELAEAKNQLKAETVLGLESLENRMNRWAKNEFFFDRPISLAESLAGLKKVTAGDLENLAQEFLSNDKMGLSLLGPLKNKDVKEVEKLWAKKSF